MVFSIVLCFCIVILGLLSKTFARDVLRSHSNLNSPPTKLSTPSVLGLFALVLIKYIVRGFGELLGFLSPLGYDKSTQRYAIPSCSVSAQLVPNDEDVRLFGLAVSSKSESESYNDGKNPLFLLVPLTNPLLLHLLTKYTTPILPLGSVNVRNRFEFIDPDACQSLRSKTLQAIATMGGHSSPGIARPRGIEFDITIVVALNNRPIFRQIFTVLQFIRHKNAGIMTATEPRQADRTSRSDALVHGMNIDFNAPARWAKLCKDYNPIHVNTFAARLFGFPGKIAHGNHVVAMVLSQLSREMAISTNSRFLEVEFRRPMVVPLKSAVTFVSTSFEVSGQTGSVGKKVFVESRWGPL